MNSSGKGFSEGQKVLVRRPPSKKFSKGLNNWVAVAIIEKSLENFFYQVELVGDKKEIKGLNLKRIHHRYSFYLRFNLLRQEPEASSRPSKRRAHRRNSQEKSTTSLRGFGGDGQKTS